MKMNCQNYLFNFNSLIQIIIIILNEIYIIHNYIYKEKEFAITIFNFNNNYKLI